MVTETDRNKARSTVVHIYHNDLLGPPVPLSFLHALADAAVDAVSTDAEPDGWICENDFTLEPDLAWEWEDKGLSPKPFYFSPQQNSEPVKTAPAVAVKALEWREDIDGDFSVRSILGTYDVWRMNNNYVVYFRNSDKPLATCADAEKAKAAAQADYESRILPTLSAQVQDEAVDGADIGRCIRSLSVEHPLKWAEAEKTPILRGWFVGQVMKHFGGKPDEKLVRELIDIVFAMYPASPASKHGDAE